MKNNKGFTLIEVLVSLALIGIIMIPAFSLLKNVLNYENKHTNITLLNQDIQIIENMVDTYLKQSDNIDSIFSSVSSGDKSSETSELVLDNVILTGKYNSHSNSKISVLDGNLSIEIGTYSASTFTTEERMSSGEYISSITVKPLPSGRTFANASGVELKYILEKGDQTKEMTNRYFFRN
jgi:prepilin-type N-terminal cleavage/methylation domain-containing protein